MSKKEDKLISTIYPLVREFMPFKVHRSSSVLCGYPFPSKPTIEQLGKVSDDLNAAGVTMLSGMPFTADRVKNFISSHQHSFMYRFEQLEPGHYYFELVEDDAKEEEKRAIARAVKDREYELSKTGVLAREVASIRAANKALEELIQELKAQGEVTRKDVLKEILMPILGMEFSASK